MKRPIKTGFIILVVAWMVVSALGLHIVIDRQKRFEAFATAHIELLMEELSVTNINVSRLEANLEKFKEDQQKAIENPVTQFNASQCGKAKQEEVQK